MVSQRVSDHAAIKERIEVEPEGLVLRGVAPHVSPEDPQERAEPAFVAAYGPRLALRQLAVLI